MGPPLAFFEKHFNNLPEIPLKFVKSCPLAMRACPAGHMANVETSVWIVFHDHSQDCHLPYRRSDNLLVEFHHPSKNAFIFRNNRLNSTGLVS